MVDDYFVQIEGKQVLMKIEAKGNQLPALQGTVRALQKNQPNIFFAANGGSNEHIKVFCFFKIHALGLYPLTFTCTFMVGGVDALNMMDGPNGLYGSVVVSALFWLFGMVYYSGHAYFVTLSRLLFTAICTFLQFNYRFTGTSLHRYFWALTPPIYWNP